MSNIKTYTQFISEQVRKSGGPVELTEATEKTAVKHELANLNKHLGGEIQGRQRTGRANQYTFPSIDTSHHESRNDTIKGITAAGYHRIAIRYSDATHFYGKKDQHGFHHTLAVVGSGKIPTVNHIRAIAS
jgi:hypothetical protein